MSDARCEPHGREATQTCRRCGVFLCDWCVKLAPDWGPGLCPGCQRLCAPPPPRRLPRSWTVRTVLGALMVAMVVSLLTLARALFEGPDLRRAVVASLVLALSSGGFVRLLRSGGRPR